MAMQPGDGEFWARFVIASLATWRVTHLLAAEDGPADIFFRLRTRLGGGFWGRLMDCFYCLSIWVAAPFAVTVSPRVGTLVPLWFALSGLACLLERATGQPIRMELPQTPHAQLQGEEK